MVNFNLPMQNFAQIQGVSKNIHKRLLGTGSLIQFLASNQVPRGLTGAFIEMPCRQKLTSDKPTLSKSNYIQGHPNFVSGCK
jgi:hypothetical protein